MPTFALNFYSPTVADQLRTNRKTATIRLGDKSAKYRKGMIVTVLVGVRYGQREKVFDAVIDKVEVKSLGELSPREIEHDNPEIRRADELAHWLSQLYNREVTTDDTVTVIIGKSEMGQGVYTGLAMVVAEELDVDPARVKVEMAGADPAFNVPGMPLQFTGADSAQSLGLTGEETIDIVGLDDIRPQQDVQLKITSKDGSEKTITVRSRIDTAIEVDYYRHGGILPYVLRELIGRAGPAKAKAA